MLVEEQVSWVDFVALYSVFFTIAYGDKVSEYTTKEKFITSCGMITHSSVIYMWISCMYGTAVSTGNVLTAGSAWGIDVVDTLKSV